MIAVLPADPFIGDERGLRRGWCASRSPRRARRSSPSAFGPPTPRPASATSAPGAKLPRAGADPVHDVAGFVEKPDPADGRALPRLGRVPVELGDVLPHRRAACSRRRAATCRRWRALLDAAVAAKDSKTAAAVIAGGYAGVPSISIDNGIMEKASGLRVVPGAFGWNDVGSWAALADDAPGRRARQRRARRRDADRRRRQHRRRRGGRALRGRGRRARSGGDRHDATPARRSQGQAPRTYDRSSRRPSRPAATICCRRANGSCR